MGDLTCMMTVTGMVNMRRTMAPKEMSRMKSREPRPSQTAAVRRIRG